MTILEIISIQLSEWKIKDMSKDLSHFFNHEQLLTVEFTVMMIALFGMFMLSSVSMLKLLIVSKIVWSLFEKLYLSCKFPGRF